MDDEFERKEPNRAEAIELNQLEQVFKVAENWGYDEVEGHRGFERDLERSPALGAAAKAYTDVVFQNFYRVGANKPVRYRIDVLEKYERQAELSELTQRALKDILAEFFSRYPIMQLRLTTFAQAGLPNEEVSLAEYGMRQGVAQLIDMARGHWEIVSARRLEVLKVLKVFESI